MRIMVISNGWGIKTIAGGEYHILKVIIYWSQTNDIVLIIPRSGYEIAKKIIPSTVKLIFSSNELQVDNLSSSVIYYLRRILGSINIRTEKPDIVISASHFLYDVLPAYIISKRFGSKLVIFNHSIIQKTRKKTPDFYNLLSVLNEKLGIYLSKNADSIFTVNEDTRKYLLEKNFNRKKIFETDNGIDKINSKLESNVEKEFDCCYCGRISQRKGIFDIIEIWKNVVKYYPKSKIAIIGDGPEFGKTKEVIKKNNLENNIILTGFLFGNEKIERMRASKIFIFPSYEEGWGIAISEALSLKLAVVCYDLEAYTIFKDGIIKIETGNIDMMTNEIIELLKKQDKIDYLSNKGYELISSFKSWENIAKDQFSKIREMVYSK